jgi:hypothetical protein
MSTASIDPSPQPLARRDILLWLALLAGPFALAVNELTSYSLAPTACAAGTKWMLHLVALLMLLVSLGGAVLARSVGRGLPEGSSEGGGLTGARARFMALAGTAMGVGFAVAIVAMEVPNWVLRVCQ